MAVGTALFLHAGWMRFAIDPIALGVLAIAAERMLGRWRMVAIYVAAGLGGMAGYVALGRHGWLPESEVVGPSGSLLGLLGALLAARYRQWRRERTEESASGWHLMIIVVVIQVVLDLAVPDIGLVGHGIGGLIGLVLGSAMTMRVPAGLAERDAVGARPQPVPLRFRAERPPLRQSVLMIGCFVLAVATAFAFPRQRLRALAPLATAHHAEPAWELVNPPPGPRLACRKPGECREV